jgi:nitroreductase
VQALILDAAVRAPSGGNTQNWRFLLVDDHDLIAELAPIYRACRDDLWATVYAERIAAAAAQPELAESKEFVRIKASADHLADHFEDMPLLLFAFAQHDPTGGSIFPAVWNAMLAARGEGIGSAITMLLVFRYQEVLDLLGVPGDEGWTMACCVTFGYPTGRWGVARRRPAHEVSYRNRWGTDLGLSIPDPLWPPS